MQHPELEPIGCWAVIGRYWEALHVERHGKYSVERLYSFETHSSRTTLRRAVAAMLLTPLPCILTTIAADLIPLESPERGLAHSQMFWLRALYICWYISFTMLNQARYFIVRLPMTPTQVVSMATFVTVASVAVVLVLSMKIGFPVPFFQVAVTPGWLLISASVATCVWGKHFQADPRLKHDLVHYGRVVNVQATMTLVYPAYIYLFQQLSGYPQTAFALVLPQVKLLFKFMTNHQLRDFEDAKPEFITFNIEVFHALYVSCCMQNAASYLTTFTLIAMDFGFAILSLRRFSAAIEDFEASVFEDPDNFLHSGHHTADLERDQLRVIWSKLRYVDAAMLLLETDPRLVKDSKIRITDDEKRAVLALSDACRARFVQHVLHLLHWTEFLLLVEFVEVIIPTVYCLYLSVAYRLPNRTYYAQLRDADEAEFHASIGNIMAYTALQALSLLFLGLVLQLRLRVSAVRQLTFVLETQWQQVQSKLIFWMAFSIQSSLDHFGCDYSFRFAWLRAARSTATAT